MKRGLTGWLRDTNILCLLFAQRVPEVSEDVMLRRRLMVEAGRKNGHTFAQPDLIITATAAHHGLTVVPRDGDEFRHAGVPVFDSWTATSPP